MKISYIILDAGNVLFYRRITERENIARALGFDPCEWDEIIKIINQDLYPELGKEFLNIDTIEKERRYMDRLHVKMAEYFNIQPTTKLIKKLTNYRMKGNFRLHTGVIETLKGLRKRYKLVVVSNALPSRRVWEMKLEDLDSYFDKIYISFELGLHKPDPRFFKYVLKDLGVSGGEVVFVDDKIEYLNGAQRAGIKNLVLFNSKVDDLQYRTMKRFSDLEEVVNNYERA